MTEIKRGRPRGSALTQNIYTGKKFEYYSAANLNDETCNILGNVGWELVAVTDNKTLYFKREKR